jgi:hypothetical protein
VILPNSRRPKNAGHRMNNPAAVTLVPTAPAGSIWPKMHDSPVRSAKKTLLISSYPDCSRSGWTGQIETGWFAIGDAL